LWRVQVVRRTGGPAQPAPKPQDLPDAPDRKNSKRPRRNTETRSNKTIEVMPGGSLIFFPQYRDQSRPLSSKQKRKAICRW